MSSIIDQISPRYIGDQRLDVALESPLTRPRALRQVAIVVSSSRCGDQGASPPFRMTVQGPSRGSFVERVFNTFPARLTFTPKEGGSHSVTLAECHHNRWWGSVAFSVEGERLEF